MDSKYVSNALYILGVFFKNNILLYDWKRSIVTLNVNERERDMQLTESLWREYEPYIRKLCNYKLNSHREYIDDCVQDVFTALSLYEVRNKKVKTFSLGMKQRLAICQAIMENPDVLLLDEPFNALDEKNIGVLCNIIKDYREKNKIIIVAAHSVNENAEKIFDARIKMVDGKIDSVIDL